MAAVPVDWMSTLWGGALAALLATLLVAGICKFVPCRVTTRYSLWLFAALMFAVSPILLQRFSPQYSALSEWVDNVVDVVEKKEGAADLSLWMILRQGFSSGNPLPEPIWLGGSLFFLAILAIRYWRSHLVVRAAERAPSLVVDLVGEAAQKIGLNSVPQTVIVDRPISPMIWCGVVPRLVLPKPLWNQLDETGRMAVLLHELAHLRRRDHWVRWILVALGVVFWWHPAIWYLGRRIREDADLCCDTWVTSVLSHGRRAYAVALLETRKIISMEASLAPSLRLSVLGTRSRRLARRLTMIMTDRYSPHMGIRGWCLIAGVALACAIAAPVLVVRPQSIEAPTLRVKDDDRGGAEETRLADNSGFIEEWIDIAELNGTGPRYDRNVFVFNSLANEGLQIEKSASVMSLHSGGELGNGINDGCYEFSFLSELFTVTQDFALSPIPSELTIELDIGSFDDAPSSMTWNPPRLTVLSRTIAYDDRFWSFGYSRNSQDASPISHFEGRAFQIDLSEDDIGRLSVDGVTSPVIQAGLIQIVPAPGALALLGVAGLVGTRRRRH